jgi:hypothetical protein
VIRLTISREILCMVVVRVMVMVRPIRMIVMAMVENDRNW